VCCLRLNKVIPVSCSSWHEIGVYDIPAALDLVTQHTGFQRIPVVGHSMGNTVMMVAGSMRPELTDKVSIMIALAPTVYMRNARSPLMRNLAALVPTLSVSLRLY